MGRLPSCPVSKGDVIKTLRRVGPERCALWVTARGAREPCGRGLLACRTLTRSAAGAGGGCGPAPPAPRAAAIRAGVTRQLPRTHPRAAANVAVACGSPRFLPTARLVALTPEPQPRVKSVPSVFESHRRSAHGSGRPAGGNGEASRPPGVGLAVP